MPDLAKSSTTSPPSPFATTSAARSQRGAPPFVIPVARYFTVHVPFAPQDLEAAKRSMLCHRTQFTAEAAQRVLPATDRAWNGEIALIPAFATPASRDLFR